MADETLRSRAAREEAERALIRVVHHYGARPEFVLLGGLVPDLLCLASPQRHAGTTDVDVQVDLEIASGASNVNRLEQALRNAEFVPDGPSTWRWTTAGQGPRTVIKFELLADLDSEPTEATINFDECETLGALNLRSTGFASRDVVIRKLRTRVGRRTADRRDQRHRPGWLPTGEVRSVTAEHACPRAGASAPSGTALLPRAASTAESPAVSARP